MKIKSIPFTQLSSREIVNELSVAPRSVVTAHAEMVYQAIKSKKYSLPLLGASIITADGVGLVWGLGILGIKREKNSGVDIVEELLGLEDQVGIYLFGGSEEVVELAAKNMSACGGRVLGYSPGYNYDKKEVFSKIIKSKAQIVLVGMGGSERQITLVNEIRDELGVSAITVGGVIDLYAGFTKRAPKLFQKVGLEWLWRVILSPRRIVKIPSLIGFTCSVIKERLS